MIDGRIPRPVDKHVGERLRMRRIMLKISQVELARQLGITFQQVQKYENGKNRISASSLHGIAQILRVPHGFFFEDWLPPESRAAEATALPDYMVALMSTPTGHRLA